MKKKYIYIILNTLHFSFFVHHMAYAQQPWKVPAEWALKKNLLTPTSTSIESGKKIYLTSCSPCHGEKGKGNGPLSVSLKPKPANHSAADFQKQKDGELYYKIITGRNAMPPYKTVLTEEEIWNVINFIRTLNTVAIPKTLYPVKTQPVIISKTEKSDLIKNEEKTDTLQKKGIPELKQDTTGNTVTQQSEKVLTSVPDSFNGKILILNADTLPAVKTEDEKRKFILTGSAHFNTITGGEKFPFESIGFETGFLPVFLWKPSKRLFFESHLHISAGGGIAHTNQYTGSTGSTGHTHRSIFVPQPNSGSHSNSSGAAASDSSTNSSSPMIMLSYANLVYFFNNYISITGGLFLSPFGIYFERMHPEWINKLPDAPLGLGHTDQFAPETELGFQIRGGFPCKKMKFHYSVYVSNGPALIETGTFAGKLNYENLSDNNSNKALGGRIGFLPLSNSSLETGISFQHAKVGTENTLYAGVDAQQWAVDLSYHNDFSFIRGSFEIKGQYLSVSLDKIYYSAAPELTLSVPAANANLNDSTYRFDNVSSAFFLMTAYRPVMSEKFIRDIELVFRYDVLKTPCYALWNTDKKRWSAGIVYWLDSRSAFKLAYLRGESEKLMVLQFVIGL